MFNNATQVLFNKQLQPVNGKYKFLVTEIYTNPDLITNYVMEIPIKQVIWTSNKHGYTMNVTEDAFSVLKEKAFSLRCEIYVYPRVQ